MLLICYDIFLNTSSFYTNCLRKIQVIGARESSHTKKNNSSLDSVHINVILSLIHKKYINEHVTKQ